MNTVNARMNRAIRFGNNHARKGHQKPFVVFYFVPRNSDEKPVAFFFNEETITEPLSINRISDGFDLYLPYAPLFSSTLMDCLDKIHLEHIYIGVDNVAAPGQWKQYGDSRNIRVTFSVNLEACQQLNQVYLYTHVHKKPFIVLSFGMSIDGKIATRTGDSRYISGPKTRTFVHQLRDRYQAILVGINTIRVDHPKLTARLQGKQARDPDKIVLDSHLSIALDEPIFFSSKEARTIIVTLKNQDESKKLALQKQGAIILEVEAEDGHVCLSEALDQLYALGIDSIFVEGGSTIHYAFIKQNLFQLIYAYISPIIIGGKHAPSAVGGEGFASLKESASVIFHSIRRLGSDIVVQMRPAKKGSSL